MNTDDFKWDDQSVREFIEFGRRMHHISDQDYIGMDMDAFKKSKQKKPLFTTEERIVKKTGIIGYKNYEIHSNGEVFNIKKGKFLKKIFNGRYNAVRLSYNGIQKNITIHRLVGIHFIPNPENKPCLNHKDGNKLNNNDWNLEWVDYSENNQHAFDTGLRVWTEESRLKVSETMGGSPFFAKRNNNIIGVYYTLHDCEKDLFVDDGNISKCLKGKHKQSNGYSFEYCTKEKAEEYIKWNKPKYSLLNIFDAWRLNNSWVGMENTLTKKSS